MSEEYFFEKRKRSFTQQFFKKGLNGVSYILLALSEIGEGFLKDLPDCYPGFKLMKDLFGVSYRGRKIKKETIKVNLYRLKKRGLITQDPKEKYYFLTDEGEEFVSYIKNRFSILKQPWDGKLRIVIFDIPEKKKYWRKWLRDELNLMQYQLLQKSVYIGKHPLPESFYKALIKNYLTEYIFILTIGEIDKKEEILKMFKE